MMRFSLSLASAVGALMILTAPVAAVPGWSTPKSVFVARFAPAHSMALDSTGHSLIASEGGLRQGIWLTSNQPTGGGGASWFNLQLTHKSDATPSIAVWNDRFYIAFVRRDPNTGKSKGLWTVTNATGTIVVTKRDAGPDYSPSVAVHSGRWAIAFHQAGPDHRLVFLSNLSGSWHSQIVDGTCCHGSISLRLTDGGLPRLAYSDGSPATSTGLKYAARNASGQWSIRTVDTHQVDSPTLVLDSNQRPHVVYVRINKGTWYAVSGGGTWTNIHINGASLNAPDVALDAFGGPHIVTGNNGVITYTTNSGTGWVGTQLTFTHTDGDPEIEFHNGSRVIFNRESGGTGDGIDFMKQGGRMRQGGLDSVGETQVESVREMAGSLREISAVGCPAELLTNG